MTAILLMVLSILPSLILGAIIVLLLRKRVQARGLLAAMVMVAGFALTLGIAALLLVSISMAVTDYYDTELEFTDATKSQVQTELMLREFVPAVLRPACLTAESTCVLADEIVAFNSADFQHGDHLSKGSFPMPLPITMVLGLIAAALNGVMVWFSTRTKRAIEPIAPPVVAG